jgi:hypothetical protein
MMEKSRHSQQFELNYHHEIRRGFWVCFMMIMMVVLSIERDVSMNGLCVVEIFCEVK